MSDQTTNVLIIAGKKKRNGRLPFTAIVDNRVQFSEEVNPSISSEVDRFIAGLQTEMPALNGESADVRKQILQYAMPKRVSSKANDHTSVLLGTDEHRVVDEVLTALGSKDSEIYSRGPILARVIRTPQALPPQPKDKEKKQTIRRPTGSPTIIKAAEPWVRERITKYVNLTAMSDRDDVEEEKKAHPPPWLTKAVVARSEWPTLRELVAVSESPVLRPDGSVHQTPGYDPETWTLYFSDVAFPEIPAHPTRDNAIRAVNNLKAVVSDFRFECASHLSAWLAALLSPLARQAYAGSTPCFLVDANIRAAGKGLLCQVAGIINTGHEIPVSGYAHDSVELGKRITAFAIAGDPIILFDNITGPFGNEALDRALTATEWKDRILGVTENTKGLPWRATIYATGNNVMVEADSARRLLHIRLDVLEEKPEERSDFAHPRLIKWVTENRPPLLIDAITILSAYCRAGCPNQSLSSYGSFEGWSDVVRSALVWCGLPDPCETRAIMGDSTDTIAAELRQLMHAWHRYDPRGSGVVISEMISRLFAKEYTPTDPESAAMRAALDVFVSSSPNRPPTARQVGARLKSVRRKVVNGAFFDIDKEKHNSAGAVWRLFSKDNAVSSDSGDSSESISIPLNV